MAQNRHTQAAHTHAHTHTQAHTHMPVADNWNWKSVKPVFTHKSSRTPSLGAQNCKRNKNKNEKKIQKGKLQFQQQQ